MVLQLGLSDLDLVPGEDSFGLLMHTPALEVPQSTWLGVSEPKRYTLVMAAGIGVLVYVFGRKDKDGRGNKESDEA